MGEEQRPDEEKVDSPIYEGQWPDYSRDPFPDQATEVMDQMHGLANAALAQMMGAILAYERNEYWGPDGMSSMADWLVMRYGFAPRSARDMVASAHALDGLPAMTEAFSSGELSYDRLKLLIKIATPDNEVEVLALSQKMSISQIESYVRSQLEITKETVRSAHETRSLYFSHDHDKHVTRVRGTLAADTGELVEKALERIADQAPKLPDGRYERFDARMADALVALASTNIAEDQDPDRATLVIHVEEKTLAGDSGVAETENGRQLHPETARRHYCDARKQIVTHGPDGKIARVGSTSSTAPRWLRRLVVKRDKSCRFPGCNRRRLAHVHHIVHREHKGQTVLENLTLLCHYHHHLMHEGGWKIRGHPDEELVFIKPNGIVFEPEPEPLRPEIRERFLPAAPRSAYA